MLTINKRLLLRLVVAILLFAAALVSIHEVQADRTTRALRWQAEHAAEAGRLDNAIYYMRQYLEARPDDHEAATQLGDMILSRPTTRKQAADVLFLYERVLREAPQRHDIRRKLVDLCLRLNRHGDAMLHARALLDESGRDAGLWEKLGIAQAAQNKLDDARVSYEKAVEFDPTRIRSFELLADLLIRQQNLLDEGRQCIEKMVRLNPGAGEAYLVRARLGRFQNRLDDCTRDLERLLEIDPENADGLLMLAELMQGKGEVLKARMALGDGMALHHRDVRFYRSLSWLELLGGNLPAAVICLEKGMKQLPGAIELLTPLGDLLIQQGEREKVEEIVRKLEKTPGSESQVRYLRGRLQMQQEKWAEALALFELLRTDAVDMPGLKAQVNALMAVCHERLGNRDAQTEALKRVLAIDAGHVNARLTFGSMHLAAGELDEAIKEYTIASRSPFASLGTRVMLGRLQIARARAKNSANEWTFVADAIRILREKHPNAVEPLLLSAELNMARQQYEPARKMLRNEAGRHVNDPRIWSVLAAIALETEGLHLALDVLDEAKTLVGEQAELRLARARVWAVDWQPAAFERVGQQLRDLELMPETDQTRVLNGLGDFATSIGDGESVKKIYQEAANRSPRDKAPRRSLLQVALRTSDAALRSKIRQELNALGDETFVLTAEALSAIEALTPTQEGFAEIQALSRRLLASASDNADVHLLAARLAEKKGDKVAALKEFIQAAELERANVLLAAEQIAFLYRQGDAVGAKKRLEQVYADLRIPGESFLGMIEMISMRLTEEQFSPCLAMAESLVKRSGVSLLWLARIQSKLNRKPSAVALAEKACTLTPKLIDAWILRIRLQPEKAEDTLKLAKTALDDRAYLLTCAECGEVLRGMTPDWTPELKAPEDHRRYAEASLRMYGARGKLTEAEGVLTKLAEDTKARPEDVVWAKRNRAMLALGRGKTDERKQAVAVLRALVSDKVSGLDEQRARAQSLAAASRHLHGGERKKILEEAIVIQKTLAENSEASARDWFFLAQFHRMAGDRDQCRASLRGAMKRDEANIYYVVAFAEDCLNEGQTAEVEPFLTRLGQATNDSKATLSLAKYHAFKNQAARAIEAIDLYAQSAEAGGLDALNRSRHAAEMLDQLARLAGGRNLASSKPLLNAALEKYRLSFKAYPESAGPMAMLLAFDHQAQAALDLLTTQKASLSVRGLTTAGVAVLRVGDAGPKHFLLVKSWLDDSLKENPNSIPLKMNLAELHALQQNYAGAEPIYREVLLAEPDNVVALNNLAWMLAPRPEATAEALKCVERAIELSGTTGELLDTRARIYIARGELDRAIEDLNLALEQSRTSLRCFHLALAQYKLLKKNEAAQAFREARSRGLDSRMVHPDDVAVFQTMASQMGNP